MALTIMNNPTAIGAMGKLNNTNSALSKTISQLSSGLRINSAADDASGLAVSEKLRGQISGLSKASSNAQDAISLLQTAEGAMGSMTDILQRMRELAVQAGDPAYTTNDRAMLQSEVDQLKEEVNRISTSAEFNTKKLLNGDAAGVWSSSSANLEAILKGTPAEGDYAITSYAAGGQNEVQKSQIMKTKAGVQVVEPTGGYDTAAGIVSINNVRGMMASNGAPAVGLQMMTATADVTAAESYIGGNMTTGAVTVGSIGSALSTNMSGYFELYAESGRSDSSTATTMQLRFVDAATGLSSDWVNVTLTTAGATTSAQLSFGGFTISAGASLVSGITSAVKSGSRILIGASGDMSAATTKDANLVIATNNSAGTTATAATAGVTVRVKNAVSTGGDMKHTLHTAQIDSITGEVKYGSMDVTFAKASQITLTNALSSGGTSGALNLNVTKEQSPATKWTTLNELSNFVNSDGRNVMDMTQTLTIYGGNGKQAVLTLEGTDTLEDIENKLTSALVDQLGMGSDNATVNENLVNFVTDKTDNTNESMKGTFVMQGATVGSNSKLSFVGDQNVLNALGFGVTQEAKDSETIVNVKNAITGEVVGEDKVSDNILRNVIQGVDVKVDPTGDQAIIASYNGTTKTMEFKPSTAAVTATYLHVKSNPTKAAIGANEGQTLDISIGRMDTLALEIDDVVVATFDDAQKSITKIDRAMETLSKARSVTGAQMNRLNYTINNLTTMKENLTSAESSLRDLDMAQASTNLTAQQVRLQAATAMLAQANQMPSYAAQLLK